MQIQFLRCEALRVDYGDSYLSIFMLTCTIPMACMHACVVRTSVFIRCCFYLQVLVWLVWLTFGFSYYGTILILPQVLPLPNSSTGNGNGTNTTAASVYTSITPGGGGYNAGIYQDGDTVRDAMLCGNSRTLLRRMIYCPPSPPPSNGTHTLHTYTMHRARAHTHGHTRTTNHVDT